MCVYSAIDAVMADYDAAETVVRDAVERAQREQCEPGSIAEAVVMSTTRRTTGPQWFDRWTYPAPRKAT